MSSAKLILVFVPSLVQTRAGYLVNTIRRDRYSLGSLAVVSDLMRL